MGAKRAQKLFPVYKNLCRPKFTLREEIGSCHLGLDSQTWHWQKRRSALLDAFGCSSGLAALPDVPDLVTFVPDMAQPPVRTHLHIDNKNTNILHVSSPETRCVSQPL